LHLTISKADRRLPAEQRLDEFRKGLNRIESSVLQNAEASETNPPQLFKLYIWIGNES
jgi:hypothetical protein